MKAILIDPTTRTVSDVEYDGDYRNISKLIDAGSGLFTAACRVYVEPDHDNSDTLWVDDEGLLYNGGNPHGYFAIPAVYPGLLAGKGLLLGDLPEGESGAAFNNADEIRGQVKFFTYDEVKPLLEQMGFA